MKAKAQYKASLKIQSRLQGKEDISQEEKSKLAWAEQKVEEGRLHYAQLPQMKAMKGEFANRTKKPKQKAKVSDVSKRHLIVALIDRSDENGKMTAAQWKQVHAQLVDCLFARMEEAPDAAMPTFDGAGWLNGMKILKCNDDPTRKWLLQVVPKLEALWEGAKLEVVDREMIPSIPKAKVLFPIAVQGDRALKLLQRQNTEVPTADWKILHAGSPLPNEGGQHMIIQINKEAEDILYPRFGKMAWGVGSVYLRLKKRHPEDKDAHTLQEVEVEKDLGLESIVEAAQDLALDDSDAAEDEDALKTWLR
ncbi:uncharacterized protein LOC111078116 [Drosophila obscura]|uniref:uncharacterized protein LOC111078116 n=1 Tax=Drosophila obscura TaxID=7282 RepID=UPI001BB1F8C9|nr:uncharacterized protein LOC111078116 [Drosophila obscura]